MKMKYKKGDRVRIVSYRTTDMDSNGKMDKYLGAVITIKDIHHRAFISENSLYYEMVEDRGAWYWYDSMIAGLASEIPFDFGAWKDKNVCMHCKTEEEADDFCHEMHKAGLMWNSGKSYLEMNCFNVYNEQTLVNLIQFIKIFVNFDFDGNVEISPSPFRKFKRKFGYSSKDFTEDIEGGFDGEVLNGQEWLYDVVDKMRVYFDSLGVGKSLVMLHKKIMEVFKERTLKGNFFELEK